MRPTVFVDTNCCRNASWDNLLGNRDELKGIEEIASIVIPSVVIDEIMQQKADNFDKHKTNLMDNPLVRLCDAVDINADRLSLGNVYTLDRRDREIDFQEVELKKTAEAFERIYDLALSKQPPFQSESDKGFKDACIAVTIEQYLESAPKEERVYLLTKDARLSDFFRRKGPSGRVNIVQSASGLIEKIREQNGGGLCQGDRGVCATSEPWQVGLVDRALIPDKPSGAQAEALVAGLRKSRSFVQTHSLVAELAAVQSDITPDQYLALLRSAIANNQIYWLLGDEDVKDFFDPIFKNYQEHLTEKEYREYLKWSGLPYEREETEDDIYISSEDKALFNAFSDMVIESLDYIDESAKFVDSSEDVLRDLKAELSNHLFDDNLHNGRGVIRCLLSGEFETKEQAIDLGTIRSFCEMLEDASRKKRRAILKNLKTRLIVALEGSSFV